ncbi:MAG: aldehyde dehydrogenase family protein [Gemmatimonadaceae bacterium]
MPFDVTDPCTGERLETFPALDPASCDALLTELQVRQQRWRTIPVTERARAIEALATALRTHRETLARTLSREMGKPIMAARAEVDKCIALCTVAPTMATAALTDEVLRDDADAFVVTRYAPLGVVLAIMPWNFPYWQALRLAVPTLLAGNGICIKPAPSVPGTALALARCFADAREALRQDTSGATALASAVPWAVAFIEEQDLDAVIADPRIAGVSLTGSDRAGRHVAEVAGRHLKKVVLELGGSDPFIVLPDADLDEAARVAVAARTVNSGQSCVAAKRFIVCEAVYDAFLSRFVEGMRALVMGDPQDERTQIGPIATARVRDGLAAQVATSVRAGARVLLGGDASGLPGFFYPPTVLVDVPDSAPAACDELFGPVAAVFRVATEAEAIARANATPFGLGASVWTQSSAAADRCIAALEAGMVYVNDMVVSDPRIPFGGVKASGMGRELGPIGYREFTNVQTVHRRRRPMSP